MQGGGAVPADAISNVTVSPTHRRRGLLTRMMAEDLTAAKDRGDVVATLIAAEYPIYGRYGFGPAAWTTEWEIDVPRAGLDPRWAGPSASATTSAWSGTSRRLRPGTWLSVGAAVGALYLVLVGLTLGGRPAVAVEAEFSALTANAGLADPYASWSDGIAARQLGVGERRFEDRQRREVGLDRLEVLDV